MSSSTMQASDDLVNHRDEEDETEKGKSPSPHLSSSRRRDPSGRSFKEVSQQQQQLQTKQKHHNHTPNHITSLPKDQTENKSNKETSLSIIDEQCEDKDISKTPNADDVCSPLISTDPDNNDLDSTNRSLKPSSLQSTVTWSDDNATDRLNIAMQVLDNKSLKDILAAQGYTLKKTKESPLQYVKNLSQLHRFYFGALIVPTIVSVWYATAILFPPGAREKVSFLLWTDGMFMKNDQGQPSICPRASICSDGVFQIILIALARLSAFASYIVMGLTFLSKMHSLIHFLSTTYLSIIIPFESLHDIHKLTGRMFGLLAMLHTVTHYLRYILRGDVNQLVTQIHWSGFVAILAMGTVTLSMSPSFIKNKIPFEKRFNLHWTFLIISLALFFHTKRTRVMILIFFGLWTIDYIYGILTRTHRLGVVEFTPIGDDAGTQMLWRNPKGFSPKSGEYVYIKLPWLSKGGNEWHPFSIYLREATKEGLDEVSSESISHSGDGFDVEGSGNEEDLFEFTQRVLKADFSRSDKDAPSSLLLHEARQDQMRFDTTQVFISPCGDWTKELLNQVSGRKQLQSCWVRGPFTSPYFIAHDFSHLILTASGIGITPALGVMNQYPGFSRTKILVWSLRSKTMLKFFAPLLKDAHLCIVFYTGKEKLNNAELRQIRAHGNIFVKQERPKSLTDVVGSTITMFENAMNSSNAQSLKSIDSEHRKAWCTLYCGGSKKIRDTIEEFTKDNGLGWECELFDW